jgi:hypothetical protein
LTVADLLTISGSPPSLGTVGTAYSGQLAVTGGSAPFSYSLAAGTLPMGLTVKVTNGIISGTPLVAGTKSGIRVKVTDASGQSATSAPFSIIIAASGAQPLVISGAGTPSGTENVSYSSQFTAGGGTGGYVYALASGTLPSGLSLNPSTGLLSGSPAFGTAGSYPGIAVQVTDSAFHVATSNSFTLIVAPGAIPLAITGTPGSNVQLNDSYAAKFTGTGGSGSGYVYALTAGSLPPGLTLNSATGLISGTATTIGTYSGIVIRVTDSAAHSASTAPFAIAVGAPPPLSIMGTATPSVNQGANYSSIWTAFDGSGVGYHFTSVGGLLPPGLSVSDINGVQGLLSGTATVAGTYSGLQIQVADSAGNTALSNVFSVTVVPVGPPASTLTISGVAGSGDVGTSYSAQFTAGGGAGAGSYVYGITAGALPPGLTLNPGTGVLSGLPTAGGTYSGIVVTVTDGTGGSASTTLFQIVVTDSNPLTISWTLQTNWQVGDFVAVAPTVAGGDANNYVFTANGTVPPGLSLFSNGTLFGNLSSAGTFGPFSITVSDGLRSATTANVTFVVAAPGLFVSGFPSSSGIEGQAYSAQFDATGGSGSGYIYSMNGTLPSGLSIDPSLGLISGAPSVGSAGSYANLSVHVVDGAGATADSAAFSIVVAAPTPPLSVAGTPPSTATEGVPYTASFSAAGGSGSGYVYSMVGTLPSGLTLNPSSGTLSGTPAAGTAGTYSNLRVHAIDSASNVGDSGTFSITVAAAPIVVSGNPAPAGAIGTAYNATFSASGGTGVGYVYSMVGTLPAGVTLNAANGVLSGTPAAGTNGTYANLKVHVIDSASNAGDSAAFTLTISASAAAPLTFAGTPASGSQAAPYGYSLTKLTGGGIAPYAYSLTSGTLPTGLSLAPNGVVSGTVNSATASTVTVTVSDSGGQTKTSSLTFTIIADSCATGVVGTVCADGSVYVGPSPDTGARMFVTRCDAGQTWDSSISACSQPIGSAPGRISFYWGTYNLLTGLTGAITGRSNTEALVANYGSYVDSGAPPVVVGVPAAQYCYDLNENGKTDWYLPAANELQTIYGASNTASLSATFLKTSNYYSSTEGAFPGQVVAQQFNSSTQTSNQSKHNLFPIRCARRNGLELLGMPAGTAATGVVGSAYAAQFGAAGGTGGYVYNLTGTLPSGLSLDPSSGVISGIPAAGTAGTYTGLSVKVTDSSTGTATSGIFQITILPASVAISISGTPAATATTATRYSAKFAASGGTFSGYVYSLSGTLPSGLSLDPSSGVISGVPAAGTAGSYAGLVVNVTDGGGNTAASPSFTITVSTIKPFEYAVTSVTPSSGGTVRATGSGTFTNITATTVVNESPVGVIDLPVGTATLTLSYAVPVAAAGVDVRWYCVLNLKNSPSFTYVIESSDNGSVWTTRSSPTTFTYGHSTGCQSFYAPVTTLGFTPATAQYWRMRFTAMGDIAEIDWFRMN